MPWKQSKKFRNFSRENCVNGSKYPMMNLPPSFELLSAIWDPEVNDGEQFAEVGKRYPVWGILSGSSVSFKVAAPEPPFVNGDPSDGEDLVTARTKKEPNDESHS